MMKKTITALVMATLFVLAMAAASFAAITEPCIIDCKTSWGTAGDIPIENCDDQSSLIEAFDFEDESYGYCTSNTIMGIPFKICECDTTHTFTANTTYVLKVDIMTEGVYWADRNLSLNTTAVAPDQQLRVWTFNSSENLCDGLYINDLIIDALGYCQTVTGCSTTGCPVPVSSSGLYSCDFTCDAKSVQTVNIGPGMVGTGIIDVAGFGGYLWTTANPTNPYLVVDIPSMVYDPEVVECDDVVTVRLSILLPIGAGGVCPTCNDPLCSCTYDVGTFVKSGCKPCTTTPTSYYKCFPYLTAVEDAKWWSALSFINVSSSGGTFEMTIYAGGESVVLTSAEIADAMGSDETMGWDTVNMEVMANSVFPVSMQALAAAIANANADFPLGERLYVQIESTVAFDGFGMVGDQAQAQGYLARCGKCGTCP